MPVTTMFYTSREVADLLGVTDARIRQIAAEKPVGLKRGRDWWFNESDVEIIRHGLRKKTKQ